MKVSVITAVFNGEAYIQEAIDSILGQTYTDLEYIIVNDGSTDKTREILDRIQDPRVKVIHLPENQGAARCMNLAASHATGEWIAVQDADDISLPRRLELQVEHIRKNPKLVLVGSKIDCISGDEGGN
ncbi:glycosyltransferase family 2 protein [Paenibacillus hexagrammi]|uniref:Glycosyltransferase n=1 Tax=Paenibacillus hexagrammi TaxID=2908839 RepID=A0ABY3SEP1_9BACL|nr:glycosyltransferase family 2 protein [Paenibacillus sp. YPD9-1]UJF31540.1 glycosyltransferase [Paenibacillus sp. YPD9-1]